MERVFLFNPNTKVLHKKPATENCNLDDSEDEYKVSDISALEHEKCAYCFKEGEDVG